VTAPKSGQDDKPAPAEVTVRAVTPAFSGLNQPSAVARCPSGYACTGGGIDAPDGAAVTESAANSSGTSWLGSFTGGPSGATATVWAVCTLVKPS
jgi:hypothetical protein